MRNRRIRLLVGMTALMLLTIAILLQVPKYRRGFQHVLHHAKRTLVQKLPGCRPPAGSCVLVKDKYSLHLDVAKKRKIKLIENEKILKKLVDATKLVQVKDGKGYKIGKLTHSHAVLHPSAHEALQRVGSMYRDRGGKGQFFTVTSLTRTVEQHKDLAKRNPNTTKDISSHSYGISFDISYVRFNGERGHNQNRKNMLSCVLKSLQEEGVIYVLEEKRQACFHVTAR